MRAGNNIEWGAYSAQNSVGVTTEVRPNTPVLAPIMIEQLETSIKVEMPEVSGLDTGGSQILSYNLQYDLGTGNG